LTLVPPRDSARKEKEERAIQYALKEAREKAKKESQDEVDFLFNLMAQGRFQTPSLDRKEIEQALVQAASCNYVATVRKLVRLGVDVSAKIGRRRETALHFAAHFGDTALIEFLCLNSAPIESHDKHRRVPLHCAAWEGHHDAVRVLLSRGADVNAQDDEGRTALFGAASGGYMETVRVLLGRGADANIRGGTKVQTALDRAVVRGHEDIAHELRTRTLPASEVVAVASKQIIK
jgi:ankyrin repeat protein